MQLVFDCVKWQSLTRLLLSEPPVFANMVPQVTPRHQVDHQVQVLSVFKRIVHIYEESARSSATWLDATDQWATYGWESWQRNFFSFMTELTLRLEMIRALAISFMAKSFFSFRNSTFQTLPKPPRPMT